MSIQSLKKIDYEKTANIIVITAIFLFAFTRFLYPPLHGVAKLIIGLGAIYLLVKNPSGVRKDPVFILFFAVLLSQFLSWLSVKIYYPDYAYIIPKFDRLGKLFFFIPIAWWLKNNNKYILVTAGFAVLGFLLSLLTHSSFISEIDMALNGTRIDFGIRNAQHTSMIFGMIFLSCIFLLLYWRNNIKRLLFVLLLLLISTGGMYATQSRQTFLSLLISCLVMIVSFLLSSLKNKIIDYKLLIFLFSIFSSVITVSVYSIDTNRIKTPINSATKLFDLNNKISIENPESFAKLFIDKQDYNSSGIRLQLWISTIPNILKKPFLGWGSKGENYTIKRSKILPEKVRGFGHLHNFFIGTLLSYGLLGLSLILFLYFWIIRSAFKIKDRISDGFLYFSFVLMFVTYWLVINNFEAFNIFWTGVFVHNIVLGCIYTKYLHNKDKISEDIS